MLIALLVARWSSLVARCSQLPPQDLDDETVSKIVHATKLIANALNVTGPFNIQFIAKDREIKVCAPLKQKKEKKSGHGQGGHPRQG